MRAKSCAFHMREWWDHLEKDVGDRVHKAASKYRLTDAALVASTIALFAVLLSALREAFLSSQWGPF